MQQEFDFRFDASSLHTPIDRDESAVEVRGRPPAAGFDSITLKRRTYSSLSMDIERPSESSVLAASPSSKLSDGQIGLAFGSPRLPPHLIDSASAVDQMSPGSRHAFLTEGTLCHSAKPKKWKLGDLFKGKHSNKEPTTFYRVQLDPSDNRKLGLPIQRTPWRNPKSPAVNQGGFDGSRDEDIPDLPLLSTIYDAAPAIEVSIPISSLERFSVMFKDIDGQSQPLMTRRSKDLKYLTLSTHARLDVPSLVRRNTSPTTSRHQVGVKTPVKYSIFPSTPNSLRIIATDSPRSAHFRSATAPGQLTPLMENFGGFSLLQPGIEATPRASSQLERSDLSNPPTAPATPSARTEAIRNSTHSEIFFDIKSYRGSNVHADQQFEMMRPPSEFVMMARSKSGARKLQESAESRLQIGEEERIQKTTSVEIDETIAAVEKLTSPSNSPAETSEKHESRDQTASTTQLQRQSQISQTQHDPQSGYVTIRKTSGSQKRELHVQVPSPVLEQSEDTTPNIILPLASAPSQISPEAQIPETAPIPTITPPSPELPAVPIKDFKFLPLSKYAPAKTTEDVMRQTGLRPTRPSRSNTDVSAAPRDSPRQSPARSSTMPLPDRHVPTSKYSTATNSRGHSKQSSSHSSPSSAQAMRNLPQSLQKTAQASRDAALSSHPVPPPIPPPKPAPSPAVQAVKPTAEVSIARTISLSRSPSARLVGSKFPKTDSKETEPTPALVRTHASKPSASSSQFMQMIASKHEQVVQRSSLRVEQHQRTTSDRVTQPPQKTASSIVEKVHRRTASKLAEQEHQRSSSRTGQNPLRSIPGVENGPAEAVKKRNVMLGVPVFEEVHRKHKPGVSMDAAVEMVTQQPVPEIPVPVFKRKA